MPRIIFLENNMLIVQKFGGSSLDGRERLLGAAGLAAAAYRSGKDVVVVVSARGGRINELISEASGVSPAPDKRELDALLATGEQASAALMAMALRDMGVPAVSLTGAQAGIRTYGSHGDADISRISSKRILTELENGRVTVVSGFQGEDEAGDTATLGRGGSDTTAAALAAALNADVCDIFTDVDGIYTADPRLVPGAVKLAQTDYRDMLLLSLAGSQVLHSKSVDVAMRHGVSLCLRSADGVSPGTLVTALADAERPAIAGVTRDRAAHTVTVVGKGAGGDALCAMIKALNCAGIDSEGGETGDGFARLRVNGAQLELALKIIHGALLE